MALALLVSMSGCYGSAAVLERTLPPDCPAGTVSSPMPRVPGLEVRSTGAVVYEHVVAIGPDTVDPITTTARIDSIDIEGSTVRLMAPAGAIDVLVRPIDTTLLAALPVRREVVARFAEGVTITDASDGRLLFAALSGRSHDGPLDAGPFHIAQGEDQCLGPIRFDTTFSCGWGLTTTAVDVVAGDTTTTLAYDTPNATATVDGRTFAVVLLRSERSITSVQLEARHEVGQCAIGLVHELAVVIGPG